MNIANIFGLHLGCKIKDIKTGEIGVLNSVIHHEEITGGFYLVYENETVPIKDCKLLLKPLSKITDEDKAEFVEKFYPTDSLFWRYMRIVSFQASGLGVYSTRREESYSVAYTYQQALFLSTKGYKIEGIVPDEYCEVEE